MSVTKLVRMPVWDLGVLPSEKVEDAHCYLSLFGGLKGSGGASFNCWNHAQIGLLKVVIQIFQQVSRRFHFGVTTPVFGTNDV